MVSWSFCSLRHVLSELRLKLAPWNSRPWQVNHKAVEPRAGHVCPPWAKRLLPHVQWFISGRRAQQTERRVSTLVTCRDNSKEGSGAALRGPGYVEKMSVRPGFQSQLCHLLCDLGWIISQIKDKLRRKLVLHQFRSDFATKTASLYQKQIEEFQTYSF